MKQLSSSEVAEVVKELQVLVSSRVNKIYQPESHELLIKFYKKEEKYSLIISSGKAIFLTKSSFENPQTPPSLCLRLRKLLDHAKVEAVKQHKTDRIVEIVFADKILIAELFGQGNFVVTDKDYNVLAAARKIDKIYTFPETTLVEIKPIKVNLCEELDSLYSSGKVTAPKEPKGLKKLKNIIEKQEASASENEKKSEEDKQKGDLIYLHYDKVKQALKEKGLSKSISLDNIEVKLSLKKTAEQNAAGYYESSKKLRKKAEGARAAAEIAKQKLAKQEVVVEKKTAVKREVKPLKWFEKFHWFYTSEGNLAVGGRDAVSNEVLVKKHVDKNDIVFHTEMEGSPFFVLKSPQKSDKEIKEVATATVSYSRAWREGYGSADVYWINPEQVKKEGSVGKGTFLIYGSKNYLRSVPLELAIGFTNQVIGGPTSAIAATCKNYVIIKLGREKSSDVAKKIIATLHIDKSYLDEVIRFLPAGKSGIVKK